MLNKLLLGATILARINWLSGIATYGYNIKYTDSENLYAYNASYTYNYAGFIETRYKTFQLNNSYLTVFKLEFLKENTDQCKITLNNRLTDNQGSTDTTFTDGKNYLSYTYVEQDINNEVEATQIYNLLYWEELELNYNLRQYVGNLISNISIDPANEQNKTINFNNNSYTTDSYQFTINHLIQESSIYYFATVTTNPYITQQPTKYTYVPQNILFETSVEVEDNGNQEVIDLPGLMFSILSMPFTFITQAFNLTLFPGTNYAINIADIILALIAALLIIFIIRKFTK